MSRGRKKVQNPKTEVIRISLGLRRELAMIKTRLGMPARYNEHDVMQAVVRMVTNNLQEKELTNDL